MFEINQENAGSGPNFPNPPTEFLPPFRFFAQLNLINDN